MQVAVQSETTAGDSPQRASARDGNQGVSNADQVESKTKSSEPSRSLSPLTVALAPLTVVDVARFTFISVELMTPDDGTKRPDAVVPESALGVEMTRRIDAPPADMSTTPVSLRVALLGVDVLLTSNVVPSRYAIETDGNALPAW